MNLNQLFSLSLRGRSEEIALEFEDVVYSFGEMDRRSNRVANLFLKKGFRKGDRLAIYLSNCLEMIDIFLACLKTGVIFVPVNILYREREVTHILSDAEPRAVAGFLSNASLHSAEQKKYSTPPCLLDPAAFFHPLACRIPDISSSNTST